MNETMKDAILLSIVGYAIWVLLVTWWFRFANWWKKRLYENRTGLKCPRKELSTDQILGKSKFRVQDELAKQQEREQQRQREEEKKQELAKKEEMRIKALALEMAKEMVQEELRLQQPTPSPQEPPKSFPKVIPDEELDAVFANEEVLSDYSMPEKFDRMIAEESATTMDELKNVVEVLKNKETTTGEQQREAVRVIAKIDNTVLFEQMLTQIDGATKYASHLIEKHYTEQSPTHPKPQTMDFDMEKYLNY